MASSPSNDTKAARQEQPGEESDNEQKRRERASLAASAKGGGGGGEGGGASRAASDGADLLWDRAKVCTEITIGLHRQGGPSCKMPVRGQTAWRRAAMTLAACCGLATRK
jgi:hypothetical protein